MSIEVFVFGANNGAFSFPDKDAGYFETTFYTDIKELPKNTPLFDVRLRQIGDQRWVDYTVLIYGLKGSRANDYIGVACRSSQAFKRLRQIYDIMQNGISSFLVNALVNEDFEALIGDARKSAEEVRSKFIKLIETHVDLKSLTSFDLTSIPSRAKGANSRLMQINPADINQYKNYLDLVVDGCMLLISGGFPSKKLTADLNHLHTQINQTKTEYQSKLDAQEKKYQADIESERTKLEQEHKASLEGQKQQYEGDLEKLKKEKEKLKRENNDLKAKNTQLSKRSAPVSPHKSHKVTRKNRPGMGLNSNEVPSDESIRCTSTDDFIDKERGVDKGSFKWKVTQRIRAVLSKCLSSVHGRIILMSFIIVPMILIWFFIFKSIFQSESREEILLTDYYIDISELSNSNQPLKPNEEYTFSIKSKGDNIGDSIITYKWIFPNEAEKSNDTVMNFKNSFAESAKEITIKCEVTTSGDQSGTIIRKVTIE